MVVDFTDDDLDGGLSRISQRTADIHVGILINNVGISYPYARFFHELDEKLTKNLLRVNIEVTTRMIQLFLPSMLKHKRGAIINIGSGAGSVLPSDPLYTLYAATKAYVHHPSPKLKHQSRTFVIRPADSYIYRKEISHRSCYIYVYVLIVGGGSQFIKHCMCSSV